MGGDGQQQDGSGGSGSEPEKAPDGAAKRAREEAAARRSAERELRRKAQLRANLQRRKVQIRARREGAEDDRPGELATTRPDE